MVQAIDIVKFFPLAEFPTSASLPYEDGLPLDSNWLRLQMNLSIDSIYQHLAPRTDIFAGGNMFIYWRDRPDGSSQVRGPDVFLATDVHVTDNPRRWSVWERNNRFPSLIIEFLSRSTRRFDLGPKKEIYEQVFQTPEYFGYEYDRDWLFGWRLINGRYETIEADARGLLWSEVLQAWIGRWVGTYGKWHDRWIRLYRTDGALVLVKEEYEAQRAEIAEERADAAEERAGAAEERAESERIRNKQLIAWLRANGIAIPDQS